MKQLFYWMAVIMAITLSSCKTDNQGGSETEPTPTPGYKNLSVNVTPNDSVNVTPNDIDTKSLSTSPEKEISMLTVVVYDKNGAYVTNKDFTAVTGAVSITGIPEISFPVKLFAIANANLPTKNSWGANVPAWDGSTFGSLSTMTLSHKAIGQGLNKGVTPLIMCGQAEAIQASAKSATIRLTRPVIRITVTNSSSQAIQTLAFTGLNAAVTRAAYAPTGAVTFTYSDNTTLAVGGVSDYYFMPQTGSATLVVTSPGVSNQTKILPAIAANHAQPITIRDTSIDCGVAVEIEDWLDETPIY